MVATTDSLPSLLSGLLGCNTSIHEWLGIPQIKCMRLRPRLTTFAVHILPTVSPRLVMVDVRRGKVSPPLPAPQCASSSELESHCVCVCVCVCVSPSVSVCMSVCFVPVAACVCVVASFCAHACATPHSNPPCRATVWNSTTCSEICPPFSVTRVGVPENLS